VKIIERLQAALRRTFSLRRSLQFVWDSAPGWTIASIIVIFFEGLLPVASIYMLKVMIDTVGTAIQSPNPQSGYTQVLGAVVLAGAISLLNNIVHVFFSLITYQQGRLVADYIYEILPDKSLDVDLEYYENAEYYDQLHRAQGDATYRPLVIVNGLARILRGAISLIGIVGLLFSFHWSIALLLLAAVLPSVLVRMRFSNLMYQLQRQYTSAERRAWYYHIMMTSVDFAKEVRVFGLGATFNREYQQVRDQLRQLRLQLDLRRSFLEAGAQVMATAVVFSSYGAIALRTLNGLATLGDMAMFYQAFQRGQGFLQDVLGGLASLYESNLFLINLYEFLDLEKRVVEPAEPRRMPVPIEAGITFEKVSFTYPNSPRQALHEVDLHVHPGEVIALVGENGSGKTTLVKLLCRLYDTSTGQICIDGHSLRDFSLSDVRKNIGVIFQDSSLDERLTAYENLYFHAMFYHVPPREASQRITALLAMVGLADRSNDRVITFSGGMKRRLEIARSILHQPQLLLLDEATVGLDTQARRRIWDYIASLRQDYPLTILLTTHYLEEAEICDRIAILDHGAVIACDTPARLKEIHGQKTLDDLFLHLTGRDLQDSETGELERLKAALRVRRIK